METNMKVDEVAWRLRERTVVLRKIAKELAGRVRALRFFESILGAQRDDDEARLATLDRCVCPHRGTDAEMGVLTCCGHIACVECLETFADQQRCVLDPAICNASVRSINIFKLSSLSRSGPAPSLSSTNGKFGAKLQRLIDIVNRVPADERCLVFVQFDDMFRKVQKALEEAGITCSTLARGTGNAKAKALEEFQESASANKVLLLNIADETASGANLTVANHIVFFTPLKAPTQASFDATETQAIGRCVRYGQQKPMVYIHRILAKDTVDVEIIKKRRPQMELEGAGVVEWNKREKAWLAVGDSARDEEEDDGAEGEVEEKGRAPKRARTDEDDMETVDE